MSTFSSMETSILTFGRGKYIKLSRCVAAVLSVIFLICFGATCFLIYHIVDYHLSPTTCNENTQKGISGVENISTEIYFPVIETTVAITRSPTTKKVKSEKELDIRLPKAIFPIKYDLKLIPFIWEGNFTFHGSVRIFMDVIEDCQNITLHADNLKINNITVRDQSNKSIQIKEIVEKVKENFLIIYLNKKIIAKKQYYVDIQFKGILNDLLAGFYRSSYYVNNETRWIAATQFEPTDARKAFPCFDEPAFKAKFQISIARTNNMSTISNMRIVETSEPDVNLPEFVWDYYEETLPMSTYLVAFVISDFEKIGNDSFAVHARNSAIEQAQYSLEIGPPLLKYFENFFGIEYPLPKLDMVALPDFSEGAMENWGLITYREAILLYQEGVSSRGSLQKIAQCVAHELAHQWFGNLVTPEWWSDLWLNEGFACFAEYLGGDSVNPEWKLLDQFVINTLQKAFELDSLNSSHPISVKVNNPSEINTIFDDISYNKGASIIRMMQNFLTTEVFHKGLTRYLKSRKYKSAKQDDLWMSMTEQSHENNVLEANITVKEIMDTWTLQANYPLVTATRDYNNKTLFLQQEMFTPTTNIPKSMKKWWIPVTFFNALGVYQLIWMRPDSENPTSVPLNIEQNEWILLNVNQTGYYRVNYDLKNWMLIIDELHSKEGFTKFDPKNRAQLLDDAFNLASAGYIEYSVALNLSLYLSQEREFITWTAALKNFHYLEDIFISSEHFYLFKTYVLQLIEPFYEDLGLNENLDEDPLTIYSRQEISGKACKLGLRSCVGLAVQHFQNWKNSPNPDKINVIPANLREIVYCTAIRVGDSEEWDFLWDRFLTTNVANDRDTIMSALGCSGEIWILKRYLQRAITIGSGIRKQDVHRVFYGVIENVVGRNVEYTFVKDNFEELLSYFGTSSKSVDFILKTSTSKFQSRDELNDFEEFVKKHKTQLRFASSTISQILERTEIKVQWMDKHFHNVVDWLTSFSTTR